MSTVLFALSMDPFHLGHQATALKFARHHEKVVVGLGVNPDKLDKYMFTVEERLKMARCALPETIEVVKYEGPTMAFAQKIGASILARSLRTGSDLDYEAELQFQNEAIAEEWRAEIDTFHVLATAHEKVSSTKVRELIAFRLGKDALRHYLPAPIVDWVVDEYYQR